MSKQESFYFPKKNRDSDDATIFSNRSPQLYQSNWEIAVQI